MREAEEDRALIEAAQRGDRRPSASSSSAISAARSPSRSGLVRDENDARELVQDAFLRVYRGLDRVPGRLELLHLALSHRHEPRDRPHAQARPQRRRARRQAAAVDDSERGRLPARRRASTAPIRSTSFAAARSPARLQAALDALPPYHRGVILMREVEGMSLRRDGAGHGRVQGHHHEPPFHARQKLQRALGDCYLEASGARAELCQRGRRTNERAHLRQPARSRATRWKGPPLRTST